MPHATANLRQDKLDLHTLTEESFLNLSNLHGSGALHVVVRHAVNPRANVASLNAGFVAAVSALELIMRAAADESFAHEGMSPQRISDSSRIGSLGFWRMTATVWMGATLYRGVQSGSSETLSKYSSTSCFLPRQSIAPAHWQIMADRIASRLWGCGQTAFPALSALYRSRSLRVDLPALGIIGSDRFVCLDCFGMPAESNPKT